MHYAFRNHYRFSRRKIDAALFQIDQQLAADDVEEFIFVVVLVPMIFAMNDSEPDDRLVHFAQRLVVPFIRAGIDECGNVDRFERLAKNVEARVVGEPGG